MQKLSKLTITLVVGMIAAAQGATAEKPFVTVNGVAISQITADMFLAQGKANGMPDSPEMKNQLRAELINRELLFQAAKQAGFDKRPEVASQVNAATRNLLAQLEATKQTLISRAYITDYLNRHPVTEDQMKTSYETNKAEGGNTEYKARHILLKTDAEAKAIIAKLDKGWKFEELAKQSIEPGASANGGDLGWSSQAKFVKQFAEALTGLKKGGYSSTPVKTEFGYHVIKLDDTRPLNVPSFNEMKPMLLKDTQSRMVERVLAELRAKARIQ